MNAIVTAVAKEESVADIVRDILKADERLAVRATQLAAEGMFLEEPNEAQKKRREEYRNELYLQLSKKAGGDAAKAARLTAAGWDDLTGHEKKALQAARTRIKTQVDNRWKRLKKTAAVVAEEAAAEEAAATGQPAPAKAKKTLMERWAAFEVESAKANKRTPEIDPAAFAEWHKACRETLAAMIEKK